MWFNKHIFSISVFLLCVYVRVQELSPWEVLEHRRTLTGTPAECTGISWLEEGPPRSLNHLSSALDSDLLCSTREVAYTWCSVPGSLFPPLGGDREPGQVPGFSTLLGLSCNRGNLSVISTGDFTVITRDFYKSSQCPPPSHQQLARDSIPVLRGSWCWACPRQSSHPEGVKKSARGRDVQASLNHLAWPETLVKLWRPASTGSQLLV